MEPFDERRAAFRALHATGCFVMPNPWDRGSAVYLARRGFRALASTSAGLAFSRGLPDEPDALPREIVLAHLEDLVAATPLPVNADYQSGYADDADGVADSVRCCVATGVAGLSIEDATNDPAAPLYPLEVAVDRVRAAVDAVRGTGVLLTARAECFLVGHPDPLAESLRRLEAYADAGADVLYAPRVADLAAVDAIVRAVAPRPVNVLVADPTLRIADLAALGVRRISVGSALARVAWTAFADAADALVDGDVSAFGGKRSTARIGEDLGFPRGR